MHDETLQNVRSLPERKVAYFTDISNVKAEEKRGAQCSKTAVKMHFKRGLHPQTIMKILGRKHKALQTT